MINNKLLDEVFEISRIIKVEVRVIYLPKHHNRYITSAHGQTDDNKQIAAHYRNKAILLLNFTINIITGFVPFFRNKFPGLFQYSD